MARPFLLLGLTGYGYSQVDSQEYVCNHGVGKDTACLALREVAGDRAEVVQLAFASVLKDVAAQLTGIPRAHFDDHHKNRVVARGLSRDLSRQWTPRQVAQVLGTEVVRQDLGLSELWQQLLFQQLEELKDPWLAASRKLGVDYRRFREAFEFRLGRWQSPARQKPLIVVLTDVRFPNEALGVKARGGHLVQVRRYRPHVSPQQHASAQQLQVSADEVVYNDGTPEELGQRLWAVCQRRLASLREVGMRG